jgi:hypothetical protein
MGMYRERELDFVQAGLRYEVYTMCDASCRAGLIASFRIGFANAPPRPR